MGVAVPAVVTIMAASVILALAVFCLVGSMVAERPALAAEGDCVIVEDFGKATVGEFPSRWKVRKDEGKAVYSVREEDGKRFLRAQSKGLGIQAALEHEWDLGSYPVLAWRWRPIEFPKGSDERESGTNDSVLAVYMAVPHSKIRGPKAAKYVWSEKVPVGTRLNSNAGLTQVRVLQTGAGKKGEWTEQRVNVRDDYLRFFETKDVPKPAGIAVLTDSDDTKSTAAGDYADFRVCKS